MESFNSGAADVLVAVDPANTKLRVTNEAAQAMYRKFGFEVAGVRKGYYIETNEDALVMWADDVDSPEYGARLAAIEADVPGTTLVVEDR